MLAVGANGSLMGASRNSESREIVRGAGARAAAAFTVIQWLSKTTGKGEQWVSSERRLRGCWLEHRLDTVKRCAGAQNESR